PDVTGFGRNTWARVNTGRDVLSTSGARPKVRSRGCAAAWGGLRDGVARSRRDCGFGEYGRRSRGDELRHLRIAGGSGKKQRGGETQRGCEKSFLIHLLNLSSDFKSNSFGKMRVGPGNIGPCGVHMPTHKSQAARQ